MAESTPTSGEVTPGMTINTIGEQHRTQELRSEQDPQVFGAFADLVLTPHTPLYIQTGLVVPNAVSNRTYQDMEVPPEETESFRNVLDHQAAVTGAGLFVTDLVNDGMLGQGHGDHAELLDGNLVSIAGSTHDAAKILTWHLMHEIRALDDAVDSTVIAGAAPTHDSSKLPERFARVERDEEHGMSPLRDAMQRLGYQADVIDAALFTGRVGDRASRTGMYAESDDDREAFLDAATPEQLVTWYADAVTGDATTVGIQGAYERNCRKVETRDDAAEQQAFYRDHWLPFAQAIERRLSELAGVDLAAVVTDENVHGFMAGVLKYRRANEAISAARPPRTTARGVIVASLVSVEETP